MSANGMFICRNCEKYASCENSICSYDDCKMLVCCTCVFCKDHQDMEEKDIDEKSSTEVIETIVSKNKDLKAFFSLPANRNIISMILESYDENKNVDS